MINTKLSINKASSYGFSAGSNADCVIFQTNWLKPYHKLTIFHRGKSFATAQLLDRIPKGRRSKTKSNKIKENCKVPTSGYIGKTKFDLMIPLFQGIVGLIDDKLSLSALLDKTIKVHDKLIENHGVVEGTSKWKAITLYATQLLEGRGPENPGWVSTGKVDKWPNKLGHLRPLYHFVKDNSLNKELEGTVTEVRRILLILFKLNRVCEANRTLDLTKSRLKFKLDPDTVSSFEQFARMRLGVVREDISPTDLVFDFYLSPNKGPNAVPMQDSALEESAALANDKQLHKAFKDLCFLTGNTKFFDFFSQCAKRMLGLKSQLPKIKLRKLTSIPDKGNKSRVIAISDFWTQSVLASIEDKVIKVTSQLFGNNCCYFSHSEGWAQIMAQPKEVQANLASLDATEWTDNLPSSLQYIVMKSLFGQKIANAWKVLAVDCEWFVPGLAQPFKYGKGQGMGTKGSFVIAQLTDLIFVEYILQKVYPEVSSPFFMKVGDDLIVYDPKLLLSREYELIGVPVNLTKSKFKTSYGNFMEFVSRNAWNGNDYSIVSPSLLPKVLREDFYSATFYNHVKERSRELLPSFGHLMALKKELTKFKDDLSLNKLQDRHQRIISIIALIGHMEERHIINESDSPWILMEKEELLNFFKIWIKALHGELMLKIVSDLGSSESIENRETFERFMGEFMLGTKADSETFGNWFFGGIIDGSFSLKQAIAIRQGLPVAREFEGRYRSGLVSAAELKQKPIDPFIPSDRDNEVYVNPQMIRFLLDYVDKIGQFSIGYKTIKRLTYFDKANTKACIHLHRHLYNILDLKESPLDLETGHYYARPKPGVTVIHKIQPHVVQFFWRLYGFEHIYSQLEYAARETSLGISFKLLQTKAEN